MVGGVFAIISFPKPKSAHSLKANRSIKLYRNVSKSNFKSWLQLTEERGFDYFKSLVLGRMNLDHQHGLTQNLDAWEPVNLINLLNGLGEYKNLSQEVRNQVEARIQSGLGTMGDIIRIMASPPRLVTGVNS